MTILTQYPSNGQSNIELNPIIKISFDFDIDPKSLTEETVFLYKEGTSDTVNCVASYIIGSKTIAIRLYDPLEEDTTYNVMLVGGESGIYMLNPYKPFADLSYEFAFTTGTHENEDNPYLVKGKSYKDAPAFQGKDGIYTLVHDKTGELVSHIVTTGSRVAPDGTIKADPVALEQTIIPPSGYPPSPADDKFQLVSTYPLINKEDVYAGQAVFTFNNIVDSYEMLEVSVEDALGYETDNENIVENYNVEIKENQVIVTPKEDLTKTLKFRYGCDYNITLYNVQSIAGEIVREATITFKTKYKPMYCSVKLIRNSLKTIIQDITDDEIKDLIYEFSIYVYLNAKVPFDINKPPLPARDFVCCSTKLALITLIYGGILNSGKQGMVKRKTLADFTIEYGSDATGILGKLIDNLQKCIDKAGDLLEIDMYTFIDGGMTTTVKSALDPRRPEAPFSWNRLSYLYPNFGKRKNNAREYRTRNIRSHGDRGKDRPLGYDPTL